MDILAVLLDVLADSTSRTKTPVFAFRVYAEATVQILQELSRFLAIQENIAEPAQACAQNVVQELTVRILERVLARTVLQANIMRILDRLMLLIVYRVLQELIAR